MTALRVKGGTATTTDQLDAERRRVNAETSVASAKAQLTLYYVQLQKSLGLGWETTQP
jgi:outer membrane protein TolC